MKKIKVEIINDNVDIRKLPMEYAIGINEVDLKSKLYSLDFTLSSMFYLEELLEFCVEEEYYETACIVRDELNSRDVIEMLFS